MFYSMIASMLAYLVLCKILVVCKKWKMDREEFEMFSKVDPFWNLLIHGKNDFFHQEN